MSSRVALPAYKAVFTVNTLWLPIFVSHVSFAEKNASALANICCPQKFLHSGSCVVVCLKLWRRTPVFAVFSSAQQLQQTDTKASAVGMISVWMPTCHAPSSLEKIGWFIDKVIFKMPMKWCAKCSWLYQKETKDQKYESPEPSTHTIGFETSARKSHDRIILQGSPFPNWDWSFLALDSDSDSPPSLISIFRVANVWSHLQFRVSTALMHWYLSGCEMSRMHHDLSSSTFSDWIRPIHREWPLRIPFELRILLNIPSPILVQKTGIKFGLPVALWTWMKEGDQFIEDNLNAPPAQLRCGNVTTSHFYA